MLRHHKETHKKSLRKLLKEYNGLWKVPMEERGVWVDVKPYQDGWERFAVLREDIRNRADSRVFQENLDRINSRQFSKRKDFMRWSYKERKWYEAPFVFRTLDDLTGQALAERHRKWFFRAEKRWISWSQVSVYHWVYSYEYHFVLKVVPSMVIQHFKPDGAWESRLQELRTILWDNGETAGKVANMMGYRSNDRDWNTRKIKLERGLAGEQITEVLEEFHEETDD